MMLDSQLSVIRVICYWGNVYCGEDEMNVGASDIKSIIGCNLPLLSINKYCCSFSHICIYLCFYFSYDGFLTDIYVSCSIDLTD